VVDTLSSDLTLGRKPSSSYTDAATAIVLGATAAAVLSCLALAVRPGYLAFTDCVPYLIQAHIFHDGHLTQPAPPPDLAPFLSTNGMVQLHGKEFSRQPPGASAIFAMLMLIVREVRLAPPVLSGVAVAFNILWIRHIYDRRTAVVAVILSLLAPLCTGLGAAAISYAPSGALFAAGMWAFTSAVSKPSIGMASLTGLFVGLQFTVRPFTAILVALAFAMVRIGVFRDRPRVFGQAVVFAASAMPGIALLLIHNRLVTDQWWPLAFNVYDPNDRIGFGLRGLGDHIVNHTPMKAMTNLVATLEQTLLHAFGVGVGLVPLVIWWLGRVVRRRRSTRGAVTQWDLSLAVIVVTLICGHMLYWCPDAVNYFESVPLVMVLIARGYTYMTGGGWALRWLARFNIALFAVVALLTTKSTLIGSIPPVKAVHAAIEQVRRQNKLLLVVVPSGTHTLGDDPPTFSDVTWLYCGLINYSWSSDQPLIYAVDRGSGYATLVAHYPRHRPYVLTTPPSADPGKEWPFEAKLVPLTDYLNRAP
jgi:hypothetical protein